MSAARAMLVWSDQKLASSRPRGPDLGLLLRRAAHSCQRAGVPGEENDPQMSLDVFAASAAGESGDHEEQGHGRREGGGAVFRVFLPEQGPAAAVGASPDHPRQLVDVSGARAQPGTRLGEVRCWNSCRTSLIVGPRPPREAMGAPRWRFRPAGTRTWAAGSQRRCGCLPEGGAGTRTWAAGSQRRCGCLPEDGAGTRTWAAGSQRRCGCLPGGLGSRSERGAPAPAGPADRSSSS